MLLLTKIGIVDLSKVVLMDLFTPDKVTLKTDGLEIPLSGEEDRTLAEFLMTHPVISADNILMLASTIRDIRAAKAVA